MADQDGRAGGLGWFVAGLLIGVAGTLITQRVVHGGHHNAELNPASSAPQSSLAASAVKPKLIMHQGGLSSAHALPAADADQSPSDVADDAAAAGMTSRSPRSSSPPD